MTAGEASCLAGGMIRLWRSWSIGRCWRISCSRGISQHHLAFLIEELAAPWQAGLEGRRHAARGGIRKRAEGAGARHQLVFVDRLVAGGLFFHGASVQSLVDILNKGLDATAAAASHTDGPGGFFLATHYADAQFFALRQLGQKGIIKVRITDTAMNRLEEAGAVSRKIPESPKSPTFEGYEFHIPPSAFNLFNELRQGGDIEISP